MKNQSIILSFRFTGALQQINAVYFFSDLLKNWFNKSINELSYSVTDKSKFYWKQKTKNLKYSETNLIKFEKEVINLKENNYINFGLNKYLDNLEDYKKDIDFSINYYIDTINNINIILNTEIYINTDWKGFIKEIIYFLLEQKCNLCYGFVFNVDNTKNPMFFVEGIGNENIIKKEKDKLFIWSNNKKQCENKIWDIFWGNLLNIKHKINDNSFNKIKEIVGEENILLINDQLFWYNLNDSLTDFDILKYSKERKELYNYFNSKLIK